jgi:hypothetical protein
MWFSGHTVAEPLRACIFQHGPDLADQLGEARCLSLCRFLDAGDESPPPTDAAGVQKAPRQEIAVGGAPALPREMSDASPQSGPKRTLDQVAVTNRNFMSTRLSANRTTLEAERQSRAEAAQRAAAEGNEWFRQFNEAEVARLDAQLAATETARKAHQAETVSRKVDAAKPRRPPLFLADQQNKHSNRNQQGNKSTDGERQSPVPTIRRLRSSAFLRCSDA